MLTARSGIIILLPCNTWWLLILMSNVMLGEDHRGPHVTSPNVITLETSPRPWHDTGARLCHQALQQAPTHTGTAGQIISENCSGTLTPTDTIRLCLVDDTHYHIVNHPALTLQYCFTDSLDSNQADSLCSFNLR